MEAEQAVIDGEIDIIRDFHEAEENEGKQLFIDDEDEVEDLRIANDGQEFRPTINKGGVGGVPHYLDYDIYNALPEFERFSFRYEDKSVFRLQQKTG